MLQLCVLVGCAVSHTILHHVWVCKLRNTSNPPGLMSNVICHKVTESVPDMSYCFEVLVIESLSINMTSSSMSLRMINNHDDESYWEMTNTAVLLYWPWIIPSSAVAVGACASGMPWGIGSHGTSPPLRYMYSCINRIYHGSHTSGATPGILLKWWYPKGIPCSGWREAS